MTTTAGPTTPESTANYAVALAGRAHELCSEADELRSDAAHFDELAAALHWANPDCSTAIALRVNACRMREDAAWRVSAADMMLGEVRP